MVPPTVEFQLLLACARVSTSGADDRSIRGLLAEGIDWTVFTRQAIDHRVASLAGRTLARVAPDAVPEELLDAFRATDSAPECGAVRGAWGDIRRGCRGRVWPREPRPQNDLARLRLADLFLDTARFTRAISNPRIRGCGSGIWRARWQ